MKSIVSLFLTFAMLIGMLPMTAWAAETDAISGLCGENLTWSFDESSGTLTISGTGDMDDYSWSQTYDPTSESSDIWVTDAPWRDYYNAIKSIVIESDVTSIGDGAFRGCSAVTSISLSNDVEALGEYSFMDCDGIIDIVIPENVKTIGEAAFSDCNALESVSILGAASIGNFAFSECANLISVELPDTLTSIGEYAFRGCEALKKVTIPSSVRTIGAFAFVWCESLDEICFKGSVPSMDGTILSGLTCNVSYPSDDETWSEELQKEFDDTITWKGNSSDGETSESSHSHSYGDWYETKAPTQEAEGEERRDCIDCDYYETRVTEKFPVEEESENSCGENLTWEFDTITGTLIISGTGAMDNSWWPYETPNESPNFAPWHDYATDIRSVVINSGVTSIGHFAFFDCVNLTTVSIPEGVTFVGCAFVGCDSLEELYIPASVADFRYPSNEGVCTGLKKIVVDIENAVYSSDESGMLYNKDKTKFIGCPTGYQGNYTIADSVTEIGGWAFTECIGLTAIELPASLKTIGMSAFWNCSGLKELTLPDSVTTISVTAFAECYGISRITIPASVTSLPHMSFGNCTSLKEVYFEGSAPDIDYECFYGTTITAYYPDGDNSWSEVVDERYAGIVEWIPYGSGAEHEHSYTAQVTPPTCTEQGYTTYTCECGDSYVDDYEDAVGHNFGEWYVTKEATEETEGQERRDCGNCDHHEIRIKEKLPGSDDGTIGGSCGDNLIWTLKNGVLTISGTGKMTDFGYVSPWNEKISEIISVEIKKGVTSIGEYAFSGCKNLSEVIIPQSVMSIGSGAFFSCINLTSVTIPEGVTSIGNSAFSGCSSLPEMIIPQSITAIDDNVFNDCRKLTKVTLPESITSIGEYAFEGCRSLSNMTLPESVISIGEGAFQYCSSLNSIIIPKSVVSFGMYAFRDCSSLISAKIPESITHIADHSFSGCSKLLEVTIPDSVISIGERVFFNCSCLTSVTIPESVESIGIGAFQSCSSLPSIKIPESVTFIGNHAFFECTSLPEVVIPKSITTISDSAFGRCSNLTSVMIPESITAIGDCAFEGCTGLPNVTIPNNVTSIGNGAFEDCTSLTAITIPENVISIGGKAFQDCINLSEVTIPESVKSIGTHAFSNCNSLTNVTIPSSVESIGVSAFSQCSNLANVVIRGNITSFGNWAFSTCSNLTNVIISGSVTSIGEYAFWNCISLDRVTIPGSVTTIKYNAFNNCSNLSDVYFTSSEDDWDAIRIKSGNEDLLNAVIHYNSTGPIDDELPVRTEYYNNHKYELYDKSVTWTEAKRYCEERGGYLVTITSAEEQAAIEKLLKNGGKNQYWLGANYTDGKYTWITGESFTYSPGAIHHNSGENYLLMLATQINDSYYKFDQYSWNDVVEDLDSYGYAPIGNSSVGFICEYGDVETTANRTVRYLSTWDPDSKTVTFGRDVMSMATVPENADPSLVNALNSLQGNYVLVDIKEQDGIDELISILPVESIAGQVEYVSSIFARITIGGTEYPVSSGDLVSNVKVDDYALCHIYDGEVIAVEILQELTGKLMGWNKNTREVSVVLDNEPDLGALGYSLSKLADAESVEFLNKLSSGSTTIVTPIQFVCDEQGFLYWLETPNDSPDMKKVSINYWDDLEEKEKTAQVSWGYPLFSEDSRNIENADPESFAELVKISALLCQNTYGLAMREVLTQLGAENIEIMRSGQLDLSNPARSIAHVEFGQGNSQQTILIVAIRGSKTVGDWITDIAGAWAFDTGTVPKEHLGFSVAKNSIKNEIKTYLSENNIDASQSKILITGHSYGAAVANLLANSLEDIFDQKDIYAYTFAAPNNIVVTSSLVLGNNIHNFRNAWDPVVRIPVALLPIEKYTVFGQQHFFTLEGIGDDSEGVLIHKNHNCTHYVNYAFDLVEHNSIDSLETRYVQIHCPVDVTAYDENGKIVGRITDNQLDESFTTIMMYPVSDQKNIFIDQNDEVQLSIVATDSGTMDVIITDYDVVTGKVSTVKEYSDIGLKESKAFQTSIADEIATKDIELEVVDRKGKRLAVVNENGSETVDISEEHEHFTEMQNVKEATCTETGYSGDEVCCECGTVVKQGEKLTVTSHDYETTWSQGDANGHWHKCKNCSAHDTQVKHTPGTAATESTAQVCTDCDYVITPATGHITHTAGNQWITDGMQHWHKCAGCEEKLDIATHSGGTPTCTKKAICTVCGVSYGKLADHDYETSWSQGNANGHWHECKNCSAHDTQVKHAPGAAATEDTAQFCTVCGYVITPALGHTCTAGTQWYSNGTYHWHLCTSCGAWVKTSYHSYSSDTDETCNVCGYTRTVTVTETTEETEAVMTETTEATDSDEKVIATETAPTTVSTEANENLSDNAVSEGTDSHGVSSVLITVFAIVALGSLAALAVLLIYKKRRKSE